MQTSFTKFLQKRWLLRLAQTLVILVLVVAIGDFIYSRYAAYQIQQWESQLERNSLGVLVHGEAYSLGRGKSAILLIHGLNENPYTWRKMAPQLAAAGYHCRVMRLPGFGEPIEAYGHYSAGDWIDAVRNEVRELHGRFDSVFIVAHSLGGATAIQSTLRDPGYCAGLVLLAPAIEVSNVRSPILPTRYWHELGKWLPFTRRVVNPFPVDAYDAAEVHSVHRNPVTPQAVFTQLYWLLDQNRNRAHELELPVLLILSPNDQVIDSEAAVKYFRDKRGNPVEIFWNPSARHALPTDYGWETIVSRIQSFLEDVTQEKSPDSEQPLSTGTSL